MAPSAALPLSSDTLLTHPYSLSPQKTNLLEQMVRGVDTEKSLWTLVLVNQLRVPHVDL